MADPITAVTTVALADNVLSFLTLALELTRETNSNIDKLSDEFGDVNDVIQKLQNTSRTFKVALLSFINLATGISTRRTRI